MSFNVYSIECPEDSSCRHPLSCCSEGGPLFTILNEGGNLTKDFFLQGHGDLTSGLSKDSNEFISYLDVSTWTSSFMHGANMLPGMYEGFSHFLQCQGTTLSDIKKIRFRKTTKDDLLYHITDTKHIIFQQHAHVLGEFIDNNGKLYYFYAFEYPRDGRNNATVYNQASSLLLSNPSTHTEFYEKLKDDVININLLSLDEQMQDVYTPALEGNLGYMWTIVLDMVNLVFHRKLQSPGVVMDYQNLSVNDGFDCSALLNGEYVLVCNLLEGPIKLGSQGVFYKCSFEVQDSNHVAILSGLTKLLQSS